ncbi:MAG: molybdenum cofactor biosynthesis protein MoaE [Planctomycetia bacterium]
MQRRDMVSLVHGAIDTAAVLSTVASDAAGANVLFVGTTRGITAGLVTRSLEYEAHEPMARGELDRLRDEAIERFGLESCAIVHRLGVVPVGEASVAIAASAPHRREAFAAAEWLMEEVKRVVPVWKREEAADGGSTWVHPERPPGGAA